MFLFPFFFKKMADFFAQMLEFLKGSGFMGVIPDQSLALGATQSLC